MEKKKGLNVSVKSFLTAIVILFVLMILTYIMTFVIPAGEFARIVDVNGEVVIDTAKGFNYLESGGISFVKWILSPVLVLGAEGNATLLAVIVFLLVIGGVFNSLEHSGLMRYMLDKIVKKFGGTRYKLMAVIILFFMCLGAFIGSFEECVPLVPIVVALAVSLGWDAQTGLCISLLAAGCGFASGVCNPFTVGVAQELAGLPMFSGMGFRFFAFILIYGLLLYFVYKYAKRIEQPFCIEKNDKAFVEDRKMDRGLVCFCGILGTGVILIFSSVFVTVLQDYTMIIVAVMFLLAGIFATGIAGMKGKELGTSFWQGLAGVFPAVIMILMASSIKYTLEEAKILDTILCKALEIAGALPKWQVILFIYLMVLTMNFFISSGSAKAFLLIPLIVPMAQMFGISAQLCIMAFAFGDGFSNVFYPTNPVLLISLGLADMSYTDWVKHTWKFQMMNLILTGGMLLLGLAIGY